MKYILFDQTLARPVTEFGNGTVGTHKPTGPLLFGDISELIRALRAEPSIPLHNQDRLTIRRATETTTVAYDEEVS